MNVSHKYPCFVMTTLERVLTVDHCVYLHNAAFHCVPVNLVEV